jgi:hypothetical protein
MSRLAVVSLLVLLLVAEPAAAAVNRPEGLRIPPRYLLYEAGQQLLANKRVSASAAAHDTMQGIFLHGCTPTCSGPSYAALRPLGLYYEYASENFGNAASFLVGYLGSYYRSHAAAMAAMHAVTAALPATAVVSACHPSRAVAACSDVVMMTMPPGDQLIKDGVAYSFKWRLMVRDNVLFEGGYALPRDDFDSDAAVAGARLHYLTRGFLSLFR